MKTNEKLRQTFSHSNVSQPNAKYGSSKNRKVDLKVLEDYIDYMKEDFSEI